jgi:hypothetical protein
VESHFRLTISFDVTFPNRFAPSSSGAAKHPLLRERGLELKIVRYVAERLQDQCAAAP